MSHESLKNKPQQEMTMRIHYLDAMRAILMMLGVVLHSAQVFNPEHTWKIYSENSTIVAQWLINVIHMFRMPAFFMISGYFALFTLKKYGVEKFLKVRLFRIALPLVMTALIINSLQTYILVKSGWLSFDLHTYIVEGQWVSHLWFLINLLIYFMVFSIGYIVFKGLYRKVIKDINQLYQRTNVHVFLLSAIGIHILLIVINSFLSKYVDINNPIININSILYYLPFFVAGVFFYANKQMLHDFITIPALLSLSIIFVAVLSAHFVSVHEGKIFKLIYTFFDLTAKYYLSALCFYLFYKFLNRESKIFYFLSDASYSVYLFHQVLVIMIGLLLMHMHIGGIWGLVILMSSVAIIALVIHKYLVKRIGILSFLFNGKK